MLAGVPVAAKEIFATWIDPHGLAISPDGTWAGMLYMRAGRYRLGFFAVAGDQYPREIVLTCGRPGGLTWSPTGDALAFYADYKDSLGANIYVLDLTSGDIFPLMKEKGWHAFIPDWSSDGKMLAFAAYPVPRSPEGRPRIFVASVLERKVKQITPGEHDDVRPFISPNGTTVAFRRGWDIWLHSLTDGTERLLISNNHCNVLHFGCFSPDGDQIVVQHEIVDGGQVFIADIATGTKRALTDASIADLCPSWSPSGRSISFIRNREKVVVIGLDGAVLWEAAPSNGRVVTSFIGTQWARKVEVVVFRDGDGNAWVADGNRPARQITHFPERPKVNQQPKQVEYPSTSDVKVPALLLEPEYFVPGKNPAVIWIHGGPSAEAATGLIQPPISCYINALLNAGFLVLLPDYRGSIGHGEAWEWVLPEHRGLVDVDDVVIAKDFLEQSGLAAPGSVAIAGHSYGGYLTLMALARDSQKWACAASLWGIWDPVNLRTAWAVDNEELPDLTQRTPLNLLHDMHTPLLVIHGALDNMSTVDEVNRASEVLRSNGTPCEMHILEDVHGLPLYTEKATKLLVAFFTQHMSP